MLPFPKWARQNDVRRITGPKPKGQTLTRAWPSRPEDAPGRRRPVFRISLLAAMAKESFALTWWLGR